MDQTIRTIRFIYRTHSQLYPSTKVALVTSDQQIGYMKVWKDNKTVKE
jgi:hypothetical protein